MHLSTYGLALFFILLPFEYPLAAIGTQSVLMLVGAATMGLAVLDLIVFQEVKIQLTYRVAIPIIWLIYAGTSIAWCSYAEAFSEFYMMYLRNCLMFILISMISYSSDEVVIMKKATILGVGLLLLYMTFVPGSTRYSSYQHRLELVAGSSNLDENYLAAILLIGFGFMMHWLINQKSAKFEYKIIAVVYCAACIYYIFATGSRSGLIAGIVMLIALLAGNIKKNTLIVLIISLGLVIVYPYIVKILPTDLAERYSFAALTGKTAESSPRIMIWTGLLSKLKGIRVLVGYGAGAASPITREVYRFNAAAHSFYIAHIVELGVIGFTLFISLIIRMAAKLLKTHELGCFAILLAIMVIGFFLDLLTTKFFWSVMMLTTVCISASESIETGMNDIKKCDMRSIRAQEERK